MPQSPAEAGVLGEHTVEALEHHEAHGPHVWQASFDWVLLGGQRLTGPTNDPLASKTLSFPLGVYIDNLSVIMFLMVSLVATLIHIYSMGYMHDDSRYPAVLCLPVALLFLDARAGGIVERVHDLHLLGAGRRLLLPPDRLLVRRESQLPTRPTRRSSSTELATSACWWAWESCGPVWARSVSRRSTKVCTARPANSGPRWIPTARMLSSSIAGERQPTSHAPAAQIPYWLLSVAGLGIFAGCVGKSAQFPLHVWLPDAMAGPTPVSALIHAATMVAAGVYLVGRFFPVFTPPVLLYIAYTGGITLFIAATIAMVQTDYKKVLAYSTVSQLGFMMLGLGVGGWAAGLFHLLTHAFFKALLFLGAGSVYHSVHTYEMPALGGLLKKMPITAMTMLVGTLAISGVPFFSGFYSKDAILAAAIARVTAEPRAFSLVPPAGPGSGAHRPLHVPDVVPDLRRRATGVPVGRCRRGGACTKTSSTPWPTRWLMAMADHHDLNPAAHAHESEPIMTWPLIILAVCSIFVGWTIWIGLPVGTPVLEKMIEYGEPTTVIESHCGALVCPGRARWSSRPSALAWAPSTTHRLNLPYFVSTRLSPARAAEQYSALYRLFKNKWYFDDIYWAVLVRPCLAFARFCGRVDKFLVDGLVNAMAYLTERLSHLDGIFDKVGVDGLVNLVGQMVYVAGDRSRAIQTGKLRNYLMFLAVGLVVLFAGVFRWVSG